MDGDTTMSGSNPSLNDLVQQAKSLGIWEDSFCAMLNDEAQSSFLSRMLQRLITAETEVIKVTTKFKKVKTEINKVKTENRELTTKLITAETEVIKVKRESNKVKTESNKVKTESNKVKREINKVKRELKMRSLEILKGDKKPLVNRTDSAPHVAALRYQPARIDRVAYDCGDGILVPYEAPYTRRAKSIDSEQDVQSYVYGIVAAICFAISGDIHVAQNRRIVGTECDILLLHGNNRIPFAAIEVKKNGSKEFVDAIFEDNDSVRSELKGKVQGEHLAQLNPIRLFGFKKVFGLISDGNHSMITCTGRFSQDEDLPESFKSPSKKSKKRSAKTMSGESHNVSPNNAIRVCSEQQDAEAPDTLYCSQYSDVTRLVGTDSEGWVPTLHVLTHFVRLALNTVESRQFSRDVKLKANLPARMIKLSQAGQSDMLAHTTIKFSSPPNLWRCLLNNTQVVRVVLFKHLGMGTNGDCCLATTPSTTSFCAVKFFADRKAAKQMAEIERDHWNNIYDELPPTRVIMLPPEEDKDNASNEDACLLMPYLLPIDGDDRRKALEDGSIRACLNFFASKGYHHKEVQWRHLGFFRRDPNTPATTKVYLCDLGSVQERRREPESKWIQRTADWIEKSLIGLENTAVTEH